MRAARLFAIVGLVGAGCHSLFGLEYIERKDAAVDAESDAPDAAVTPACRVSRLPGPPLVPVGDGPYAVVAGDFNRDGKTDLASANYLGSTLSVTLGRGDGTFEATRTLTTSATPINLTVADIDDDTFLDLLATSDAASGNGISIHRGRGDGTFAAPTFHATGSQPRAIVVVDLDNDGFKDIAVAAANSDRIDLFYGSATTYASGTIQLAGGTRPRWLAVADVDGDQRPDLVMPLALADVVTVVRSTGPRVYATPVQYATGDQPAVVVMADVDATNGPDIIVANYSAATIGVLLNSGTGTFASQVTYAAGSQPYDLVARDLDGDQVVDIAVNNYASKSVGVYRGTGSAGTFAAAVRYPTLDHPNGLVATDLDGDAQVDLAVGNYDHDVIHVLPGTPSGFEIKRSVTTGAHPIDIAAGNLNGNATTDFVVANYNSNNISVALDNGGGFTTTTLAAGTNPYDVAIGDLDNDGDGDIVVASYSTSQVVVFTNAGDGTFGAPAFHACGAWPRSVELGDVNGDTRLDITVTNYLAPSVSILLNTGTDFADPRPYTVGMSPFEHALGDFDGNGSLDIVVANYGNGGNLGVLQNNGDGTFAAQRTFSTLGSGPTALALGDLTGDSALDVAVANYDSGTVGLLRGLGNGDFAGVAAFPAAPLPRDVVVTDLTADGRADVAIPNYGPTGHFVTVLTGNSGGSLDLLGRFAAGDEPTTMAAGDFDGDGHVDLVTTSLVDVAADVMLARCRIMQGP